jgi:hypothetical protein
VTEQSYGQASAVGTSTDYARADHTHGTPASSGTSAAFFTGLFGDASDGDVTITGFTTLSREMHYNNLTITAAGRLKPAGFRIFVAGTLTIAAGGSIDDNGNSTTNQVGATGFAARGYVGGAGTNGGAGWSAVATQVANGNAGIDNANTSLNASGVAPAGGVGGNGTGVALRTGGLGGAATQPSVSQKWSGRFFDGRGSFGAFNGGAGGGGGASSVSTYTSGTFISGGGGSGAGAVWIAANTIANSGNISANGGNGANASVGVGVAGMGGGGGGGGGLVAIITKSTSVGGTVSVTGGSGGTGAATGGGSATNGASGTSGTYALLVVS